MSDSPEPVELLARALDQTGAIVARVTPDQDALPTPCADWDVRALIDHLIGAMRRSPISDQPVSQNSSSHVRNPGSRADAYREAAEKLLESWRRDGALEGSVQLRFGEVPAAWRVHQQICEMIIHGWDIARATGQSTALDPELARFGLEWSKLNLPASFRGEEGSGRPFGLEVPVPDDAPIYDRFAAFFGRDPR